MTARRWHRPLDEALASQAVDRAEALARIRAEEARPRLIKQERWEGFLSGYTGLVVNEGTGETLAKVWAFTQRGMRRRREVAFLDQVDRLAEGRAES